VTAGRGTVRARRSAARPSPVFLGLVALWVTGGVMAWLEYGNPTFNLLLFVVAGWIVSLSLHEFSHAYFAYRAGDRAVADRGYLTLNPLKYAHPLLSIGLPVLFLLLGGIGLPGGAVWVDRHAIRGRVNASLISLVGPGANVVFLLVLAVPFLMGARTSEHPTFWAALALLAFLQLTAAVLNLLPVPGLDGGNALRPWLSGDAGKLFDTMAPFGLLILFGILFVPQLNDAFFTVVLALSDTIGVPRVLIDTGLDLLQFWR
jgi:Zn-dependent protease